MGFEPTKYKNNKPKKSVGTQADEEVKEEISDIDTMFNQGIDLFDSREDNKTRQIYRNKTGESRVIYPIGNHKMVMLEIDQQEERVSLELREGYAIKDQNERI